MDTEKILQELDRLFATYQMDKVEGLLLAGLEKAKAASDTDAFITLMNEMIGYYRETGNFAKACSSSEEVLSVMEKQGMKGSISYATTLLNAANAYRAAGRLEESMVQYNTVFLLYKSRLEDTDFRYAALYNNLSLLYQELGEFEKSCDCLEKALSIVRLYGDARIETAVTYTNLAMSQMKLFRWQEAMENLKRAFSIFEMDDPRDFHYSGALSAMGEAQYMAGNLEESSRYYQKALEEIRKNTGENHAYEIVLQNLNLVRSELERLPGVGKNYERGMELCEDFYREYGEPMILTRFPQFAPFIAAGLVGEGSECFGFDDEVSRDHDFGPGFCLWLTDPVYDEIGEKLQAAYDELPVTYMGVTRKTSPNAPRRVGVFRIHDFYENLIGTGDIPATENQWLYVEDYRLAAATNGKVFRDDLGEFTRIRKGLLQHYPEEVRVKKIAQEAALMAQTGQYNYRRMLGRGEKVTAQIALSEFMKHTMYMVYLLNRRYAPFYKWMHRGMEKLPVLSSIRDILTMLTEMPLGDERISETIEVIVALIIAEMKKQSLTTGMDNYLEHHTENILRSLPQKKKEDSVKGRLVDELTRLEFRLFGEVKNLGGRADCQDDWNTFSVMRGSQYDTWSIPMLQSYIRDFQEAEKAGWNLMTEKYARMMETTDPAGYALLRGELPEVPEGKRRIVEEIIKIEVSWMEEFAGKYPASAARARSIRSAQDTLWNTSYETYLRGELLTYSDRTLDLYGRFIAGLCREGENLAEMIMRNTALRYGYGSLEALEATLSCHYCI